MSSTFWTEWALIAGVHLLAVASPGPDFAVTIRESLRYGSRTGQHTAVGIGTGILLHAAYTLLGFGLLITRYEWAYNTMRFVAAGYLIYLGILSLRAKPADPTTNEHVEKDIPSFARAFRTGFLTNAFNPKVTLFFLSVYTAVVADDTPLVYQATYGVYMAAATIGWFSLVAWLFGNSRVRSGFQRIQHWIERVIGVVLIALAIRLLLD